MALSYSAAKTITHTPLLLATATYDASAAVDNTIDLYEDVLLGGFLTTGTAPTANKRILVFLYASWDGTTYSGGVSGADGGTPGAGETGGLIGPVWVIETDATSAHQYEWGPISLAAILGVVPPKWGIVVWHDTGVALLGTAANQSAKYQGIKY